MVHATLHAQVKRADRVTAAAVSARGHWVFAPPQDPSVIHKEFASHLAPDLPIQFQRYTPPTVR